MEEKGWTSPLPCLVAAASSMMSVCVFALAVHTIHVMVHFLNRLIYIDWCNVSAEPQVLLFLERVK